MFLDRVFYATNIRVNRKINANIMKVGDTLYFKKFKWVITEKHLSPYTHEAYYKYRVYRKYFKAVHLTNTKVSYIIRPWRWNFLKNQLKKNPEYHYNMSLWSNLPR